MYNYIQDGFKSHVLMTRVGVSGYEKKKLHRKCGTEYDGAIAA